MKMSIVGFATFFFLASFIQVGYLHWIMDKDVPSLAGNYIQKLSDSGETSPVMKMHTLTTLLEADAVQRRYRQGAVALMARIWVNYLGFVTGMILSMIGAVFILGKLDFGKLDVDGKYRDATLQLKSTSPGIVLVILGVALMVLTIVTRHEITIKDQSLYTFDIHKEKGSTVTNTIDKVETTKPQLENFNE